MNVTIVGAGNVGTQIAVHCANAGHEVTIFSPKHECINDTLTIVNEKNQTVLEGMIKKATNDKDEAFKDAEVVFVVVPAFMIEQYAEILEYYANEKMKICIVPGTGGGECAFRGCLKKGATVFGVQRVPSVARIVEYGKIVKAIGYRQEMFVASLPKRKVNECCKFIENVLDIKTSPLPNYLNITLTPSNPILHTTRLCNLFGDYTVGKVYESVPLFYEGWNDETSELLLKCDREVQEICQALQQFDLSYVKSLKEHYESPNASALTKKIKSIDGFKGLTSPAIPVPGGYIPDFDSRYFTADFNYGLTILVQIAKMIGTSSTYMQKTLEWYKSLVGEQKEYKFVDYGISTTKDFIDFYSL